MNFSDEQYFDLKHKFIILFDNFILVVRKYKYCCDHFLFAASLLDELYEDFLKNKEAHCALTLLSKIEYLLRTLARIESLQNHGACLPPAYNG
jgi:hypothetical protein